MMNKHDMIVVIIFHLFWNKTQLRLVLKEEEDCNHIHIMFDLTTTKTDMCLNM